MKNSSRMPALAAIALILTMAMTSPWTVIQESVLFAKAGSNVLTLLEEFTLSDQTAYYDRRPGGGMEKDSDTTEGSPDKEDPTSGSGDTDLNGEDSVPGSGDTDLNGEDSASGNGDTDLNGEDSASGNGDADLNGENPAPGSGDDDPAGEDSVPAGGDSGSPEEEAAPDADAAGPDMEEASSESAAGEKEEEEEFDDGINNFSLKTARAEYDQVDETIIYTDDLTDAEKAAELTEMYLTLPESIRGTLEEYDCAIYLSGEANLEGDGALSASEAAGAEEISAFVTVAVTASPHITYTKSDNRIISVLQAPYIVYFSMYESDADSLIHEVGHVLDYIAGLRSGYVSDGCIYALSNSEEWEEIYAADADAIAAIDETAAVNAGLDATECFAEAFRLAYTNPDALIAASPAAWNYVQQAVAETTT